ncbi:putative transcription factor bHLH041 [Momordica charantia]|uniref:Transcription factor bHLH041 n=1 Tax=Momordica charantia TaxID=3673 RepID=A0A6J1DKX4_MOMCH|nr:putative transcription factor bHLH041 [Momordica charantia]
MELDVVFSLDEGSRATFLRRLMHSFHCIYICVWSHFPLSNCLLNLDRLYREDDDDDDKQQASSSLGSFDRRLFNDYTQLVFNVQNNLVPGHAFNNNISFLELRESLLQTHASYQIQRQFYAAAGIKSSVFMGSSNGEIELGFWQSEVNMVEKMKVISELIPRSWAEVASSSMAALENPPVAVALTSSSSSSLKSPISTSMGSPETSCSLFQTDLSKILLQPESAFKKYAKLAAPAPEDRGRRQISMVKKWIMFYRNLNSMGITRQLATASGRPASAQLLHMISERRRRQKLNDSFQALRSLLPPPTKKDKASVLATTREYLTKLKAQVSELSHKNRMLLEAQPNNKQQAITTSSSVNERFTVRVSHAPAADEAEKFFDLEITVRSGEGLLMANVAIRVLQFLRNAVDVGAVLSFRGDDTMAPSSSLSRLAFRFTLQGGEWDESAFVEAVRRIVSDVAPHKGKLNHNANIPFTRVIDDVPSFPALDRRYFVNHVIMNTNIEFKKKS